LQVASEQTASNQIQPSLDNSNQEQERYYIKLAFSHAIRRHLGKAETNAFPRGLSANFTTTHGYFDNIYRRVRPEHCIFMWTEALAGTLPRSWTSVERHQHHWADSRFM
jgi:hypothetical protein